MVVVRHQAPRVDHPTGLRAGLAEALQECQLGFVRPEDVRPVVATVQHMINPGLRLHPQRPRHSAQLIPPQPTGDHKLQRLTPFGRSSSLAQFSVIDLS